MIHETMDPDLPQTLLSVIASRLLRRMSTMVGGKEAALLVCRHGTTVADKWRVAYHVRGGDSTETQRQAAVEAFVEIVARSRAKGTDDAVPTGDDGQHYCIVTFYGNLVGDAEAALAVIVQATDRDGARQLLAVLRGKADA
jgi:hypothetical protein